MRLDQQPGAQVRDAVFVNNEGGSMRVLLAAARARGARCLEHLVDERFDIAGVLVPRSDVRLCPSQSTWATARRLRTRATAVEDINSLETMAYIKSLGVDVLVLCSFSQILNRDLFELPSRATINLHPGKLPEYRGGNPLNWAIIRGEKHAWLTIHHVVEEIDAGAILAEQVLSIEPQDSINVVRQKALRLFPPLLAKVLYTLRAGPLDGKLVDLSQGTYYPPLAANDARINWQSMSAEQITNLVRAFDTPYSGAFAFYEGKRVRIWRSSRLPDRVVHFPGRVCMRRDGGRVVAASDKALLVEEVQLDGNPRQPASRILKKGDYLT